MPHRQFLPRAASQDEDSNIKGRIAGMTLSLRRIQTVRNCWLIAALATCALAWVAILTFDLHDWPNRAVWPRDEHVNNACGRAGSFVAFYLFHYIGAGVYPLMALLTLCTLHALSQRRISALMFRIFGLALLVCVSSSASALITPNPATGLIEGRGGILGIAITSALLANLSTFGSTTILVAAGLVALLLTVDDLLIAVPGWMRAGYGQLAQVGRTLRAAGKHQTALTPVMMGAGSAATAMVSDGAEEDSPRAAADPPARPNADAKQEVEFEDEDDDVDAEDAAPAQAPERDLIIRMLGRDRVEGKPAASAWPTELGDYVLPPLSVLRDPEPRLAGMQEGTMREKAGILERTMQEFRIEVRVVEIDTGPVITMFELELSAGTKVSQIVSLSNDIARALKAPAVRVVAPIPGKNTIGIEVPNTNKEKVRLKELIMLGGVKPTKMGLPVFIGKNASGDPLIVDVTTMPHMLIAGTTGSGKSVCINSLVMSILMTQRPDHVKLILVDPKMVELSAFKDIPHLMCPIVTDMQRAEMILEWATTKMDERYELLAEAGVRDILSFNRLTKDQIYERFQPTNDTEKAKIPTHLPYIVIVIDELADLMMTSGKEVEHHLSRLAQKSRAVGIHLMVATQRPQANVVTGLIKSNLPCRVAFRVASRMDSRIVLDQNGAEVLMGEGDMLFLPPGSAKLVRAQGTYIEDDELRAVIKDLAVKARPEFHHELQRLKPAGEEDGDARDPLFDDAVSIIVQTKRGSVSLLQRRLEVGYSRASRLIDQMASAGIVGEYKGSQAREVLITEKEWTDIRKRRDTEVSTGAYRGDMNSRDDDRFGTADIDDEGVPDLIDERSDIR
jgi:S-DNA-T family DNA segregation ATPase FtsK/SpoIIIE